MGAFQECCHLYTTEQRTEGVITFCVYCGFTIERFDYLGTGDGV